MFCIKCGAQIRDDAVFCPKCGERVSAEIKPENNKIEANKAKKKIAPVIIGAGAGVGALVLAAAVITHFNGSEKGRSDDSFIMTNGNDNSVDSEGKNDTDNEEYYPAENLSEYLGVSYLPDAPFTYYLNGERIITDNKGNIMVREVPDYEHKEAFPDVSDFHGNCRIGRSNDHSILINRDGEIVYTNPEEGYYMYSHELRNGRVLFEGNTGQNCWLVDENGNEITKPTDNVLSCGADYYTVRTEDWRTILYDCDDKVIFEGGGKVRFGIKQWEDTGEMYLWVNDGTNYSDSGEGDVTVYQLPEMNVVFTAQKVLDVNEFGSGVVFALVPDILSNNARVVVIYKGQVTIDTMLEYDQRISVKGKYSQDRVIVDHDSYDWVYTTYELSTGRFISENTQRSAAGQVDEELFDKTPTEFEKNEMRAEKLGLDMSTYNHEADYAYQMPIRAELFDYLEKETGRRVFCNYTGTGLIKLVDDVSGNTIIYGREMYAPIPDDNSKMYTVFAYASNKEGEGQLVNLATGRKLNVQGEFIGFQKIYAVFKEDENTYRVYNFDLDSFTIDMSGNPSQGEEYEKLKKNEIKYDIEENASLADDTADYSEIVDELKRYTVKKIEKDLGYEDTEESVDDYLSYEIVRSADVGNGEYAYLASFYVYRLMSGTVLLTPDGQIYDYDYDWDKSMFEKYRNYFSFDITDYGEYAKMSDDPTYKEGGYGYDEYDSDAERNLARWPGMYWHDNQYIDVLDTYTTGQIYFGMTTLDASGEETIYNEYTVDFTNEEMTEFTIPYQAGVNEVFRLADGGIYVSLDNGMVGANDGFYIKY